MNGTRHMKYRWLVLLSLFTFHLSPSHAQHYVGASLAGSIPLLTDNIATTHAKPSYGGELGAVYEYHSGHLFVRTGVQYALACPAMTADDRDLEQAMIDTRGVPFIYRGQVTDRTDRITAGQLGVPLYIGGIWRGWYGMAGLKLTVSLHAKANMKAGLQTLGDYMGRYYDPLEHMPNHGYHDVETVTSSSSFTFRQIDVRIGGEIGYTFVLPSLTHSSVHPFNPLLRLGAFAEYGLLNACNDAVKQGAPASVEPDYSHYMSVTMYPVHASSDAAKSAAHWLVFGIRLTVLYPVSFSGTHPCNCYGVYR